MEIVILILIVCGLIHWAFPKFFPAVGKAFGEIIEAIFEGLS